jgi:hypothetical protein
MSILSNKYVRDLRTFPADARLAWKRRGLAGVWREISARTVRRVWERTVTIALEHDLDSLVERPPPEGIRFAALDDADWPALARVAGASALRRLRTARDRGRIVTLAWRGTEVVGWGILSFEMDADLERYPMPLPPRTVYGWDLAVVSGERGRGTGASLTRVRAGIARELGATRLRALVERGNEATHRIGRASFRSSRVIGELRTFRLLGYVRHEYRPIEGGQG